MQIVRVADAARGLPLDLWKTLHGFGVELDVRSGQCAVAADIGAEHVLEAELQEIVDRGPQRDRQLLAPAVDGEAGRTGRVEPHVEREHDARRAELAQPGPHLLGLSHRRAADHDAGDAAPQHLRHRGGIAQAAAHLQIDAAVGRRQFADDVEVAARAVTGAVQVDHVQPFGAIAAIAHEQFPGIGVVAGFRREIAVQQAHAAAVLQVDGGYEHHGRGALLSSARKFFSSRAPTAAERSGWNWAP